MRKIKVYMITKSRHVDTFTIDDSIKFFRYRRGYYFVDRNAVNLTSKPNKIVNPTPELIYFEGNPLPVNSTVNINSLLDDVVLDNFFREVSGVKHTFLDKLFDYAFSLIKRPVKLLEYIILIIVAIFVVISVAPSFLGGLI